MIEYENTLCSELWTGACRKEEQRGEIPMSETAPTEHREVIERYLEGFNEQDPTALPEVVTEDIVVHGLIGVDGDVHGVDEYAEWATSMLSGLPDADIEIDEYLEVGNKVTVRWTVTGTHRNDLFGLPPTGESFEITGLAIFRIEDGKIAEKWYQQDDLGMLQQTGAVEAI